MNQHNNILQKNRPKLLLIATSARVLLESAVRGGYRVAVIDAFCDREVVQHASCALRVRLCKTGRLDDSSLAAAIKKMCKRYADTLEAIVVGSGIEGCEASLEAINRSGLRQYGNDAKSRLAYKQLGHGLRPKRIMPIPEDRFPYLHKSVNGNGGGHIRWATELQTLEEDYYRQSYMPLTSISHLFIAEGKRIETIGFSTQWHSKHDPISPFCYGGAISAHNLDESCIAAAEVLAEQFDLKGMNNIDYLYDGTKLYFLELNPRPSATMELYDGDYTHGLLHAHIKACRGEGLEKRTGALSVIKAIAILYADKPIHLPSSFKWQNQAKDIPIKSTGGYYFEKNAPICTIYSEATKVGIALSELQIRIRETLMNIGKRNLAACRASRLAEPIMNIAMYS